MSKEQCSNVVQQVLKGISASDMNKECQSARKRNDLLENHSGPIEPTRKELLSPSH